MESDEYQTPMLLHIGI